LAFVKAIPQYFVVGWAMLGRGVPAVSTTELLENPLGILKFVRVSVVEAT
jgi:hypothetical protein